MVGYSSVPRPSKGKSVRNFTSTSLHHVKHAHVQVRQYSRLMRVEVFILATNINISGGGISNRSGNIGRALPGERTCAVDRGVQLYASTNN